MLLQAVWPASAGSTIKLRITVFLLTHADCEQQIHAVLYATGKVDMLPASIIQDSKDGRGKPRLHFGHTATALLCKQIEVDAAWVHSRS